MIIENISIKQRVKSFFDSSFSVKAIKEDGFSLLIVLLFVGVIGSLFSGMLWYQQGEALRKKSFAAGWHLVQLSKAARIYVRDRSSSGLPADSAFTSPNLLISSVEVTVPDLIAANLLPTGFSSINPLGQNVRIFADNYPPNGAPVGQVPTAYLITEEATIGTRASVYATARNMVSLMQGAREAGMAASAPLIANGVNSSDDCSGSPAVMIWDTGCLNATDIDKVTGSAVAIAEGQVIVPAWRVVNQDFRALMRYQQPENLGANTMLTDLHMGHATDPLNNPDAGGVENRFNISNLGELTVAGLFAADQGGDGDETDALDLDEVGAIGGEANSTKHVLNITGNLIANSGLEVSNTPANSALPRALYLPGNAAATNTLAIAGDATAQTMTSAGTITSMQNAGTPTIVAVGAINTADVSGFEQVNLQNLGSAAVPANLAVSGDGSTKGSLIVQDVNAADTMDVDGTAAGADVRVFTQVTMNGTGPRQIAIQNTPILLNGVKLRAGTLEATTITTPETFLNDGGRVNGSASFTSLDVTRCDGECPDNLSNNPPTGP